MSKEEREVWNGYEEWLAEREAIDDLTDNEIDMLDQQAYMKEMADALWY